MKKEEGNEEEEESEEDPNATPLDRYIESYWMIHFPEQRKGAPVDVKSVTNQEDKVRKFITRMLKYSNYFTQVENYRLALKEQEEFEKAEKQKQKEEE